MRQALRVRRYISWRISIPWLLVFLFAAYKILYSPRELERYTDQAIADVVNAVSSPFYSWSRPEDQSSSSGQESILVVLYDDQYLNGREWGFSPNEYKPLLSLLASGNPAGIFFDIQFLLTDDVERRAAVASLYDHARVLDGWEKGSKCRHGRRDGVPIVFGSVLGSPEPAVFANGEWVSPARCALAETNTPEQAYSLREREMTTAAFEMYRLWCSFPGESNRCPIRANDKSFESDMFVEWGYAITDEFIQNAYESALQPGERCQERLKNSWNTLFVQAAQIYSSLIREHSARPVAPCLYHRHVTVPYIAQLAREAPEEFSRLLEGNIVFIGANVSEFSDDTRSPVFGVIPGVFRHAMALDNLIERGSGYTRWVDSKAMQLLILLVVVGSSWVLKFNIRERTGPTVDMLYICYGSVVTLSLWFIVLTTMSVLHWAPNTWVNYLLILMLIARDPLVASLRRMVAGLNRISAWTLRIVTGSSGSRRIARWHVDFICGVIGGLFIAGIVVFVATVTLIGAFYWVRASEWGYALNAIITLSAIAAAILLMRKMQAQMQQDAFEAQLADPTIGGHSPTPDAPP